MKEKIKVLIVNTKKRVKKPGVSKNLGKSMGDFIEEYVPGMYTFSEVYASDAIEEVETLRPEIIWIPQETSTDSSELIKEIKRIHSMAAIFMMFFGVIEDEQEVMNTYSALGAYKCYFLPPMILDTLVHDMYVALHLE